VGSLCAPPNSGGGGWASALLLRISESLRRTEGRSGIARSPYFLCCDGYRRGGRLCNRILVRQRPEMPRDWTNIGLPAFAPIRSSACTCELTPPAQPGWAQDAEQVERMFIYALAPGETIPSVETTALHVARLLSERYDPQDERPWNYNWYAVVETANGDLYQSGPHRDVDFGHQMAEPPAFLSHYSKLS